MNPPSVIAFRLEEAKRTLAAAGVGRVEVSRTAPPAGGRGGAERVVRERRSGKTVHLVAAEAAPGPGREAADL